MTFLIDFQKITQALPYCSSGKTFFSHFPQAFEKTKQQVLKLETKQEYQEPGNPSWKLLQSGKFEESIKELEKVRKEDELLYKDLKERRVTFTRTRPIQFPLTNYLKWELESYRISSEKLENILCFPLEKIGTAFSSQTKDFMVFDEKKAFIHNYDENGLIQGGWICEDPQKIQTLKKFFEALLTISSPFTHFL